MPVWDLPEGDEMGPRPGVRSLTRNRDKATAYLGMYVRPHKTVRAARLVKWRCDEMNMFY